MKTIEKPKKETSLTVIDDSTSQEAVKGEDQFLEVFATHAERTDKHLKTIVTLLKKPPSATKQPATITKAHPSIAKFSDRQARITGPRLAVKAKKLTPKPSLAEPAKLTKAERPLKPKLVYSKAQVPTALKPVESQPVKEQAKSKQEGQVKSKPAIAQKQQTKKKEPPQKATKTPVEAKDGVKDEQRDRRFAKIITEGLKTTYAKGAKAVGAVRDIATGGKGDAKEAAGQAVGGSFYAAGKEVFDMQKETFDQIKDKFASIKEAKEEKEEKKKKEEPKTAKATVPSGLKKNKAGKLVDAKGRFVKEATAEAKPKKTKAIAVSKPIQPPVPKIAIEAQKTNTEILDVLEDSEEAEDRRHSQLVGAIAGISAGGGIGGGMMDLFGRKGKGAKKIGKLAKITGKIGSVLTKAGPVQKVLKVASMASKVGAGVGMAGKGILGKGVGMAQKATSVGKGAMSMAKGAGKGMASFAGKAGGMAAKGLKFIPGIGLVAGAGMAAYDAYSGWEGAGETFGTKDPTTQQKTASATGSVVEGLTFGLLDQKEVATTLNDAANALSDFFSSSKEADKKSLEPKEAKQRPPDLQPQKLPKRKTDQPKIVMPPMPELKTMAKGQVAQQQLMKDMTKELKLITQVLGEKASPLTESLKNGTY